MNSDSAHHELRSDRIVLSRITSYCIRQMTRRYAQDDKEISRLLHWVVVGAGPTGVELCAEMSDFVTYAKQNKLDNDALLQIIVTHDLIRFYDFLSLYMFVAILRFQLF